MHQTIPYKTPLVNVKILQHFYDVKVNQLKFQLRHKLALNTSQTFGIQ